MQNAAQPMAEAYQQEHKKHHSWQKVVTVLSSIVVFCTTYALILPAITWDRTLICEKPEHVHTDECYEIVETEEEPILICEDPDHEHDRTCYYVPEKTVTKTLVCEIEEHEHTDACFDAPPAEDEGYYCGYIAHTHNELCYSPSGKLRCTIPEHVHELLCESNTEDVETEEIWTEAFAGSLSDDVLENMATIAESQIGYTEKENNFILEEDGETKIGYTRYGDWNGAPYEPWETDFAGFCLAYSKAKETPFDNDITNWMALLEKEGLLLNTEENGEPDSGYVVFYERAGRSRTETTLHVGVVDYRMEDGTLVVIGGDEDGSVEIFMIDEATVRSYLIPRKQTRRLLAAPAAAPLGAAPVGTVEKPENGYWVLASKIDDIAVDYLITYGDYALTYNATGNRGAITKTAASGYTNYYTIDGVTDNMKARFGANVDGNTVPTTVKVGSSNLRLSSSSIFGNSRSINVVDGGNTFQIYYNNNGTYYYLIYQNNAFSRSNNNNTSDYRNMTLYKNVPAQTVTFDPGGGSGTAEEFFLPKGQKPAASETIPTFTRDGYTFLGWSSDGGTTVLTEAQIRDLAVNSDVTYTAQWEKIPDPTTDGYWVRVDKVDATDADYLIVASGTDYALTNGTTNHTALKKTAVPGFSDTYLISNVTDQMKVRFGATVDGKTVSTTVKVGSSNIRLGNSGIFGDSRPINVVDQGDTFQFNYSQSRYLRHQDSGFAGDSTDRNRNMILYKNVPGHTVKFEPGEASGEEKSIAVPEGKTLANAEIPTYTYDSEFLGWSSDGGTTILTTEEVKALPITEDVTFVAMWEENKVSVHFDLGEQSENMEEIDDLLVKAGKPISEDDLPVPLWNSPNPLPFEGWYLDSNFETPYNGQTIDEETTLYAKFGEEDNAYYVYYYDYDRGLDVSTILRTFAVEEGGTLKPYDLRDVSAPEGQNWDGKWYLDEERTEVYDFSVPVSDMEDYLTGDEGHDLYLWPGAYNIYRVIFITNGNRLAPALVQEGTRLNLDDYKPTKDGYEFAGWYADEAMTQPVSGWQEINDTTYFYAKWTPGYTRFIPVMHTENAADFNFTSAGLLDDDGWYALTGSTVYVKSDGPNSATHRVYCKLPGDNTEYPVYTNEPTKTATGWSGTQATVPDIYNDYFIFYDETSDQWNIFKGRAKTPNAKPYTTNTILPAGDTIVAFSYLRARMDIPLNISNSSGYMDMYTLVQNGIVDGTTTATSAGNNSCTGTFADGATWRYEAASNNSGTNKFILENVKYEEYFPTHWPMATWITNRSSTQLFYTWRYVKADGNNQNQTSRLINFTSNFISGTGRSVAGRTFTAIFSESDTVGLLYAVEVLPGETADFTYNGTGYKINDSYTQLVHTPNTFSAKQILGCEAGATAYDSTTADRNNELTRATVNGFISSRSSQFSDAGTTRTQTSDFDRFYVFRYDRYESTLEFNFAYDVDGDGHDEIVDYANILYGEEIGEYRNGLPGNARHEWLTRPGYVFKGWMNEYNELYTDEDWDELNTQTLANGAKMVFTAKWEPEEGNIIEFYDSEFSLEPAETHTFYDGEYVAAPSDIEPDLGWIWTNSDTAQKAAYNGDTPLYGEYGVFEYRPELDSYRWVIKVYGQWSGNNATVYYDANSKKGGIDENAPKDGKEYTLGVSSVPVMALTDTTNTQNKVFVGWKLRNNGVIYQPGDHVLAQWMPGMTFVAQWVDQAKLVHLRYNRNAQQTDPNYYPDTAGFDYEEGAKAGIWDNTRATGEDYFTREGYRFIGWSTTAGVADVVYRPGDSITLVDNMTTLYAQWERSEVGFTITKYLTGYTDNTKEFQFTATLDEGETFPTPPSGAGYTVTDNEAHFTLTNGQSVTLVVAVGSHVTVRELNSGGYHVQFSDGNTYTDGDFRTYTIEEAKRIGVENIYQKPLPQTGGIGEETLYTLGVLLIAGGLVYGFIARRRERRAK